MGLDGPDPNRCPRPPVPSEVNVRFSPWTAASLLLLSTGMLIAPASSARADDWPSLRPGMWSFTRTIQSANAPGKPRVVKSTRCVDPVADMKQQNARMTRAGCTVTPIVRRGSTFMYSAQCKLAGMTVNSKSVLTVESPTAYRLHVDTLEDGVAGKEDLVARRVGDCQK
jgi:hypothetical protein